VSANCHTGGRGYSRDGKACSSQELAPKPASLDMESAKRLLTLPHVVPPPHKFLKPIRSPEGVLPVSGKRRGGEGRLEIEAGPGSTHGKGG